MSRFYKMPLDSFTDDYFMQKALNEAKEAFDQEEIPVGAVVVCEDRIIGKGFNQVEKLNDVTAHAEIIALTAACNYLGAKYLDNCKLYVTLEPCAMCASALYNAHITQIYYGASDPKKGYSLYTPSLIHPKSNVKKGLMEQECSLLLNSFFDTIRKP
jgi:tRNA(adenine34) deaminase